MMVRPSILVLTLMTAGLAGCVASDAAPADAPPPVAAQPQFDETTGSIVGSVTTDELAPIAGAQVGVLGTTLVAVTDAAGRFALNFVPPGKASVSVIALGFFATTRSVEVLAGTVTEDLTFILAPLPSTDPYHTIGIFPLKIGGAMVKPTPDCMFVTLPGQSAATTKTCNGANSCVVPDCSSGNPEQRYGYCGEGGAYDGNGCDLTPEWQTIIGELSWTPASGVTGRGWIFEVLAPNVTRSGGASGSVNQADFHDWYAISSKSPIVHRIDDATFAEGSPSGSQHPIVYPDDRCGGVGVEYPKCGWAWRVFPGWCTIGGVTGGLAGCENFGPDFAVDQLGNSVTVYFSYFIREAAPPGWTALPDA
jgi:hypothetical protein